MPPNGGGLVLVTIPTVRTSLTPIFITDEGLIKKVRGVAFCTRVNPTILTRCIESCRGVLNNYLPDVNISADSYRGGKEGGGDSPGYSIMLGTIIQTSSIQLTRQ